MGVWSRRHSVDQPRATTMTELGPFVAAEAEAVAPTVGPATTRTLVAVATDAADVAAPDGYTTAEVQLVYSTGQADDLLPKYDCVVETNRFPYRCV